MGLIQELATLSADLAEAAVSVSKLSDALKKAFGPKEARSIMTRLRGPRADPGARHKAIQAVNVWVHDLPAKKRILGLYKLDTPAVVKHAPPAAAPAASSDSGDKKDDKKSDKDDKK